MIDVLMILDTVLTGAACLLTVTVLALLCVIYAQQRAKKRNCGFTALDENTQAILLRETPDAPQAMIANIQQKAFADANGKTNRGSVRIGSGQYYTQGEYDEMRSFALQQPLP